MGAYGRELLEIADRRKIPTVMLTNGDQSGNERIQSDEGGAVYYISKDNMTEIDKLLADILSVIDNKESRWGKDLTR